MSQINEKRHRIIIFQDGFRCITTLLTLEEAKAFRAGIVHAQEYCKNENYPLYEYIWPDEKNIIRQRESRREVAKAILAMRKENKSKVWIVSI